MFGRNIALGDGEQRSQACFRGQKVVAGFVQFLAVDAEADGKQTALLAEQEREVHREGEITGTVAQRGKLGPQRVDVGNIEHAVGHMAFAGLHQRLRPLRHLFRSSRFHLMVKVGSELVEVTGENRKVDDADRGEFVFALHRSQRGGEAGNALFQTAAQRTHVLAVVRQVLQRIAKNAGDIAETIEIGLKVGGRGFRPFAQRRGHGNEMAGKIAAVHRRDVALAERLQRIGVIPVDEVTTILLHLFKRRDRIFQPLDGFLETDPAEAPGGNGRQQVDTDIGGRGARGDRELRRFLHVVRRQVVLLGRDERVEIAPGAATDATQADGHVIGNEELVFGLGRLADIPRNPGRKHPEQHEGDTDEEGIVTGSGGKGKAGEGNRRRMPHLAVITGNRHLRTGLHAGGGTPFQHLLAADEQTVDRTDDCIRHHPGAVGDEDDAQRHLGVGVTDIGPQRAEMHALHDIRRARQDVGDERDRRGNEQAEDQDDLPDECTERIEEVPAEHRSEGPGNRGQRATQVVEHLPAAQRGNVAGGVEDIGN